MGRIMRSLRTAMILAVIIVAVISSSAAADEWFIHEHKQYWWYYVDNPGFYAVVPNTAERYYKKTIFGYQFLEMSWENGSIVMQIGIIPKSSVNEAVSFVAKRWSPLLENELVFANRKSPPPTLEDLLLCCGGRRAGWSQVDAPFRIL